MGEGEKERIGLFGGSFDPIHNAHLAIASEAAKQLKLDRVFLIPAAQSPLKSNHPKTTSKDRVEMIRMAIESYPELELSTIEIDRGGVSYSIDTVESFGVDYPEARLFWIIGGDQARQLDQWRRIDALSKRVDFICLDRKEDTRLPLSLRETARIHYLKMPRIDISSTDIRKSLNSGSMPKYCLPEPVFQYIKSRNLYRDDQSIS